MKYKENQRVVLKSPFWRNIFKVNYEQMIGLVINKLSPKYVLDKRSWIQIVRNPIKRRITHITILYFFHWELTTYFTPDKHKRNFKINK